MPSQKPASKPREMLPVFDRVPKSRAEYCWSSADKRRLRTMVEEGCEYDEIAAQIGRTEGACKAMHNLLTKRNV